MITVAWMPKLQPGKSMADVETLLAGTPFMDYASGDVRFAAWLYLTDRRIKRLSHGACGLFDLGDNLFLRDMFDAEVEPKVAALDALEADDLGSMVLADMS